MFFDEFDFYLRNFFRFSRKNYSPEFKVNPEVVYVKELLENFLDKEKFKQGLKILDIGSKNWCYVRGEWDFFSSKTNFKTLSGIEIDAYRLNTEFYSRYEIAQGYIKDLPNTHYIAGDLMKLEEQYDCIIWLLPFLHHPTHKAWGLPFKHFQPEKMLQHAFNLLNKNGFIFILNQGKIEFEEQKKLYVKLI